MSHVTVFHLIFTLFLLKTSAEVTQTDLQFLNELPIDKLLRLKNSLQVLVKEEFSNVTTPSPTVLESFGAQAMPLRSPVKRGDYEEVEIKKGEYGKMSNIFSLAITTLAFLAFGGYLLCLIVQAVKAKQNYYNQQPTAQPTINTLFLSNAIKKRPQTNFASSYGRKKREVVNMIDKIEDIPPEQLFTALLGLCEGYTKWSEQYN